MGDALKHQERLGASKTDKGRYRLLVDAITDYAIYMLDPAGIVTSWNPGAQRFKGYTADEIIGRHFSRFYTEEEQRNGVPKLVLETAAREGRFESEGWRVRKDGSRFWANVVIDAIRSNSGQLIGFAKVTRDLTERRKADEALRKSEEQFRLLIQGVTDYAIYMLDPEGRVASWNAGAQRIKGYLAEEIIGKHFSCFYTGAERQVGIPAKGLDAARREGRWEREGLRVRKDGSTFWAHVVIDAIRDPNGKVVGFAKVTRDITERKLAQAELEKARESSLQSQKMEAIGQLTGGVAHDFNNMLAVVIGSLELLKRRAARGDKDFLRFADSALDGAERAAALTRRLLAFARQQPLAPQSIECNKLVAGMSDLLTRTLGELIKVQTVLAGGLWRTFVDPSQLEAAIVNLAVNSRDAMPEGGKLTVETANASLDEAYAAQNAGVQAGQYVLISVTDTGEGMTPEVIAKAFEPFFTTKDVGKGTGLGLSQVFGFIKQSSGHVKIYSGPGEGTTVKLYLPRLLAATADVERASPHGEEPIPVGSADTLVLVVEDEPRMLRLATEAFRDLGYGVLQADSPTMALGIIAERPDISLLFTDVVMPGMSGRQLAERALHQRPDLKVIYTTGFSRDAFIRNGLLDHGINFLSKPFSLDQLARNVHAVLKSPK